MNKVEQVLEIIKTMSVWELKEATDMMEKEFDVVGKAPEPIIIEPEVEEVIKDSFDVIMTDFDPIKKIRVIKEVRTLLGTPLKETKDLVETKNLKLAEGCNGENADKIKTKFEELGCTIVLK